MQYSYDAKIGNRYHGAMTYYALQSLEAAKWSTDYKTWVPRINALLRRDGYDQNPQLEGRTTREDAPRVPLRPEAS